MTGKREEEEGEQEEEALRSLIGVKAPTARRAGVERKTYQMPKWRIQWMNLIFCFADAPSGGSRVCVLVSSVILVIVVVVIVIVVVVLGYVRLVFLPST